MESRQVLRVSRSLSHQLSGASSSQSSISCLLPVSNSHVSSTSRKTSLTSRRGIMTTRAQQQSCKAVAAAAAASSTTTTTARFTANATQYRNPRHSLLSSQQQSHSLRCSRSTPTPYVQQRRTLIAAPGPNSGPIMERRPDRELPDLGKARRRWLTTIPVFAALVGISALAIFNYEKSSSSVVGATMYSLRTHPRARALLGDEVYFRDRFPWIWGELNQVKGRIDIGYGVKGTKGSGFMRFKAVRRTRMALFETIDWTLELPDGTVIRLLDDGQARDPYGKEIQEADSA